MSATAGQIKELRQATGAGILDCRNALEETGGDFEKAAALLKEKGLATAAKRADRETREGMLELYSHGDGRVGVMVEVNCETDFVGRTAEFRSFAHEVALQVAAGAPRWLDAGDIPADVLEHERQEARRRAQAEGKPEHVLDKIVEGRLQAFYQESCLLQQGYIRDDSKTVADLLNETIAATGEKVTIRRFVRWTVGQEAE
jgi:elongation factor Ts